MSLFLSNRCIHSTIGKVSLLLLVERPSFNRVIRFRRVGFTLAGSANPAASRRTFARTVFPNVTMKAPAVKFRRRL